MDSSSVACLFRKATTLSAQCGHDHSCKTGYRNIPRERRNVMRVSHRTWKVLLIIPIVAFLTTGASQAATTTSGKNCSTIQKAINKLPASGGQVIIKRGNYICTDPIVIDRDNVELLGESPAAILRLASGANAPVLVMGQMAQIPSITRKNIHIANLTIDGNRTNQTYECFHGPCTADNQIYNNGISVRRCEDCSIERVTVFKARSGGLVADKVTRRLTVRDFNSFDNQFDGLAAYETENSLFSGINVHDNGAAGLSFDWDFNNNIVSDTVIVDNAKVGIFMRDSKDNFFHGFQIRNSGEHGIFLAQVENDATKPAQGNTFSGIVVSNSAGAGIRVNDASCVNNLIVSSQFVGNNGGCISEAVQGLVSAYGNICR